MHKVILLILVVAVSLAGIVYLNDGENTTQSNQTTDVSEVVDMSQIPQDLGSVIQNAIERQVNNEAIIIDVRTDTEWNAEHASDAIHWGLVEHLENGEMPNVDKDAEIYVYCRSGNRSGQAIRIMQEAGFTNLTNIGGLDDWVAAGGSTLAGVDGDNQ